MSYNVVFHVDLNDETRLDIALANVANRLNGIPGEEYSAVVLFNGPGVNLIKAADCSGDHKEAIAGLQKQNIVFEACQNAINKFGIAPEELVDGCKVVPSGIPELIELQNKGFAYIKP